MGSSASLSPVIIPPAFQAGAAVQRAQGELGKLPLTPVASAPPVPQTGQNTPPFVGTVPSASPFQAAPPAEARLASGQPAQAGGPATHSAPKKAAAKASAGGGGAAGGFGRRPAAVPRPGSRLQRNSSRENLSGTGNERGAATSSGAGAGGAGGAGAHSPPPSSSAAGGASSGNPAAGPARPPRARCRARPSCFRTCRPFRATGLEDLVRRGAAAQVPQPALKLGLALAEGRVRGANARCIAMLEVLREVVLSFRSSGPGREAARELQAALNGVISFLVTCRPLSISMGSAIKQIKAALEALKLEPSLPEQEVKDRVAAAISTFVQEKILFASDMVARVAAARVRAGDVIVTYGYSSVVASVLLHAARREGGPDFSVVVVDARPFQEGRRMLRALADARVPAQYVSLNGLNYVLPRATKCLLGAGGVLSNGAVLARVGTAAVGMAAAAAHVPVLVACETYKFHERVQLDSFTHNELGDPELIVKTPGRQEQWLKNWQDRPGLGLLSLMYDTMPAQFVSMVITELGAIPPTSVPVVLREFRADVAAPA
ncbi:hypothetical protein QBZ16_002703 [Prototheca wickerhamii]|uniref:Translation initiation factor eIF2B subunit delta n=1 Tax=Prototheca wickerhamii TaxID=3111 RepID=A0AAD9IIN4_PROWI|nr:hypothetical protein QBZ16_002703 [Prototheca wickerhamii]